VDLAKPKTAGLLTKHAAALLAGWAAASLLLLPPSSPALNPGTSSTLALTQIFKKELNNRDSLDYLLSSFVL
jgi:hypothetical protein